MKNFLATLTFVILFLHVTLAQHVPIASSEALPLIENVEAQPLLAQSVRLEEALTFLGSSLSKEDADRLPH